MLLILLNGILIAFVMVFTCSTRYTNLFLFNPSILFSTNFNALSALKERVNLCVANSDVIFLAKSMRVLVCNENVYR